MSATTPPPATGLQRLLGFTLTCADPEAVAAEYLRHLGWYRLRSGRISAELSRHWSAPAVCGRQYVEVAASPHAGEKTFVRFVEQAPIEGLALLSHGWNAIEVLCEDPYSLAQSLNESPFRVVIPPRPLPFDSDLHAMQVIGPGGELLYFTSLPRHKTLFDLRPAERRVDQPFIAILGGPSLADMMHWYREAISTPTLPSSETYIKIINDTFGLPAGEPVPLGIVKLPRDFLIEVDEHPRHSRPRPRRAGELPPGIAIVTASAALPSMHSAQEIRVGAAGEWLEVLAPN